MKSRHAPALSSQLRYMERTSSNDKPTNSSPNGSGSSPNGSGHTEEAAKLHSSLYPHIGRNANPPILSEARLGEESERLLQDFKVAQGTRHLLVNQELSYAEYLKEVIRCPRRMIRNTFQYTADALESFGSERANILGQEVVDFKLRTWPWESPMVRDRKTLEGQELALHEFYQQMKLFGRREYANRMFIFHGPPGSGKTRLNDTIDAALEHYSENDPSGALYRLVWVFSEEGARRPFGFAANTPQGATISHEECSGGGRIIYRPLGNTDPLFLLSRTTRERLLTTLEEEGRLPADLNSDYLLRGELDTFSEGVLEALESYYRAEQMSDLLPGQRLSEAKILEDVLSKHVRVERYTLSRRQGRGLCSIWGSPNRNADIEPFYDSFSPPPEQIRAAERDLSMSKSFMVEANRGHLHFSDLFRPDQQDRGRDDISHLNHLLNEIESGHTQIFSLRHAARLKTEKVNALLRADANDEHIDRKRTAEGWDSLGRRLHFIVVPHITRFLSEAAAQRDFFDTIVGRDRGICPHVLETVSLFVTATRLLRPEPSRYAKVHERLPNILGRMNVVEKALLLQESRPEVKIELNMIKQDEGKRWNQDELGIVKKFLPLIASEYMAGVGQTRFSLYDGGFGISTANAQDILRQVAVFRPSQPITVIEVLGVLHRLSQEKFPYYAKIDEAKQHHIKARLEDKQRENERNGKTLSEKDVRDWVKPISDEVEKQFPVPSPDSIIKAVEVYAKRRIEDDIYTALGIANEDHSTLSIRRYLAHARVSIGQAPLEVEAQHRVTEREVKHNDKLLEDFESKVVKNEDLSTPEKRLAFRKHLFEQIGNWQAEHPLDTASNHYESIFGELVEGMKVARKEGLEKRLREFEQLSREYADDPSRIRKDVEGKEDERRRAQRWQRAIRALEENGYPREERWETIRKHLEWAMTK